MGPGLKPGQMSQAEGSSCRLMKRTEVNLWNFEAGLAGLLIMLIWLSTNSGDFWSLLCEVIRGVLD